MSDAYDILGLTPNADEAEIRKRYLELVREFPPDRAPERFMAIRQAYAEVCDPHQGRGVRPAPGA
jgi:curved DNA-binding protein CbpA